jgi:peroxiredoxin
MGTVTLRERLDAFRAGLIERITPEKRELLAESEAALLAADRGASVPQPGELAPDFTLPDQKGERIALSERLARGPVVLVFFRGGWCPFCTLTLRAWQDAVPALRRAGGQLLAVTPQLLKGCAHTADRDMIDFRILSDEGNHVAAAYRVLYELPEGLRPFYIKLGHDLPAINGTGSWIVPLPATFVIGQDGKVARAHVGPLVHQRLEPSEAIAAVRELASVHA